MVQTFAAYTHSLPDPQEHPELMEGMPQARREKIKKHKTVEGRRESLGAGLLLNVVLKKYGISPEMVETDKNGKPRIEKLAQNLPELCFNLSHSGNLVVCAVSEKEVGCDAEKIRPARMKVAKRFFSEEENQYLEMLEPCKEEERKQEQTEPCKEEERKQEECKQERTESGEESTRDHEFCRLWTMREAYIKMTGEGMRLDFRKFEVRPELEWKKNSLCIFREGVKEDCHIQEYGAEGYCISVCARETEFAESIKWVEL